VSCKEVDQPKFVAKLLSISDFGMWHWVKECLTSGFVLIRDNASNEVRFGAVQSSNQIVKLFLSYLNM
jgi:hypothetical protein